VTRTPEPQQRLILLAAGTAARRRRSLALGAELARGLDWDALIEGLRARRLLTQLGPRILELSRGSAPVRFDATLEQELARTRRQALLLESTRELLQSALHRAGIRSLDLKGPSLAEALYGDAGRRPASDVDLLVDARELGPAIACVRALGFAAPRDHVGPDGLPLLHFSFCHERCQLPPVDLHWRVHWYDRDFAAEMLQHSVEQGAGGRRRARPADELASLLLFYARDGFVDLRLAADIGAWWDARGATLARGALGAVLERHESLRRALLAALAVTGRMVGVPAAWLLDVPRRPGARTRLAAALANPNPRTGIDQVNAEVALVDWLLTPRGGQREFLRRQLLPPRAVLAARAHARRRHRPSPAGHCARVLARQGLALARVTGELSRQAHNRPFSRPRSTSYRPV
jgi:hypothetical protein